MPLLADLIGVMLDINRARMASFDVTWNHAGKVRRGHCAYVRPSRWWLDMDGVEECFDGTQHWRGSTHPLAAERGRPDHRPHALWTAFPLVMPIWGRGSDAYRMSGDVQMVEGLAVARLIGGDDLPAGEVAVDLDAGLVRRLVIPRHSLLVENVSDNAPDPALFGPW